MVTLNVPSYDHFDLKHYDEQPLSLEEASRKASELRAKNPGRVYRVIVSNERGDRFHVESLSASELYAGILGKLMTRWARMQETTSLRRLKNG